MPQFSCQVPAGWCLPGVRGQAPASKLHQSNHLWILTHWGWEKMAVILLWNSFPWIKFHWNLFQGIWTKYGLVYRCIYASLSLSELKHWTWDWNSLRFSDFVANEIETGACCPCCYGLYFMALLCVRRQSVSASSPVGEVPFRLSCQGGSIQALLSRSPE